MPYIPFVTCHPPNVCSLGIKSDGVTWDTRSSGLRGTWDIGMLGSMAEGSDQLAPTSTFNSPPRVSVDHSRVQGFITMEVWGGALDTSKGLKGWSQVAGFSGFRTLKDMRVEKRAFSAKVPNAKIP